jgi:hypothetical protein
MNRLTSLFTHAGVVAALIVPVAVPALAQSAPRRAQSNIVSPVAHPPSAPGNLVEPMLNPNAIAPTPLQAAQQTAPPAPRAETPRAPSITAMGNTPMPSATNIRLDLTITDTYTGAPVKKTVSMLVLTGNNGMIRTSGSDGWSVLNVDAVAAAYTGGQVSLRMTFEYTPAQAKQDVQRERAPRLNESITVVLQDGKPLMVSQSADPATDRKVTAELTATILK